jgi:RNA polymerase sigma factor (sigma-70 family)
MAGAVARKHGKFETNLRAAEYSDEDLLDVFLGGTTIESQEAFRSLVARHGPMVLGTCRHVLGEHHDAEDAFQATFLVLARKGATIRNRRVLAGWLHEVAHRIAVKSRATAVRRRNLERQCAQKSPPAIEPDTQDHTVAWNELRPLLHAEVERLPERYRIPVILSYLEGKTNEEVAALLGWPVGTVKGRLSRARDLLRSRLIRRGLALSAAFVVTALARETVYAEVVPAQLARATVRRALTLKPQAAPAGAQACPGAKLPNGVDSSRRASPRPVTHRMIRGLTRRAIFLLAVLFFGLAASVWLGSAVASGGNANGLGSAMSAFDAAWSSITRPACH